MVELNATVYCIQFNVRMQCIIGCKVISITALHWMQWIASKGLITRISANHFKNKSYVNCWLQLNVRIYMSRTTFCALKKNWMLYFAQKWLLKQAEPELFPHRFILNAFHEWGPLFFCFFIYILQEQKFWHCL